MSTAIDPTTFNHIDPSMDDGASEEYPLVAWVYGKPQVREIQEIGYSGGWFLDAEQAPIDPMPEPWTPWERPVASGNLIDGWAAPYLHVAVLRQRRCWFWVADDHRRMYPYRQFDRCKADAAQHGVSPSGRLQLLVAIPKIETPMVLTFKGAGSQAIAGTRDRPGVLTQLDGELVSGLKRLLHKAAPDQRSNPVVPRCTFWITLGAQRDGSDPHFVQVGSGQRTQTVTLPAIHHLAEKSFATLEDFQPFYVGPQRLEQFQTWFQQTENWVRAWDTWEMQTPGSEAADPYQNVTSQDDSDHTSHQTEVGPYPDIGIPTYTDVDTDRDIPF